LAKTANSSKKTGAAPLKDKPRKNSALKNEISAIILLALALLLCISVFGGGRSGTVGTALGGFFKALLGKGVFIPPLFAMFWAGMIFLRRGERIWSARVSGLLLLCLAVLPLLHINYAPADFGDYIENAKGGLGGGICGALISFVLQSAFGRGGAIVIAAALCFIGLLMLTRFSLLGAFKKVILNFMEEKKTPPSNKEIRREKEIEISTPPQLSGVKERPLKPHAPLVGDTPPKEEIIAPPLPENKFSRTYMPIISDAAPENSNLDVLLPDGNTLGRRVFVAEENNGASADEAAENGGEINAPNTKDDKEKSDAARKTSSDNEGDENAAPEEYCLPDISLLEAALKIKNTRINKSIMDAMDVLEQTLEDFGVKAKVSQVVAGPAVTRYELHLAPGVKVSRITSLSNDIALSLAASDVRIEAPIPGKSAVGIEVPRAEIATVYFREIIENDVFRNSKSKISFVLGKDIGGEPIIGDLSRMPHLLIAGATGSGKSICLNSIICSFLFKAKPDEVNFLLIDPKKVELNLYENLPHLCTPVVTDNKKAAGCLKWAVKEMENRYSLFEGERVKNFETYNERYPESPLAQIVIIIDELADLMMVAPADVEESICRLAQMARAAGMHLIVATQRPSVDVITGLIKANIPSRIAFAVSSNTDSRTILDSNGAEKLLGKGDMLYHPTGMSKPLRVQGTFINEKDIASIVKHCRKQKAIPKLLTDEEIMSAAAPPQFSAEEGNYGDPLFFKAARMVITNGQASTSYLQRKLSIGNPRAGRIMDILEQNGIVSGPDGAKPRNIRLSLDEFNQRFSEGA
jgi:S-DNA-T family DNA segregation ATPase FtsK/SpoIIIE